MKVDCRIVILNYNGRELLEKCLPSVVAAAAHSAYSTHVTVLDNCSADESQSYVTQNYPKVDWVAAPQNKIFCSYNAYAASVTEDVLLLLNNDIRVELDFVDPLIRAVQNNPAALFAAPKTLNVHTGGYEGGRSKFEFRFGLPWGMALFNEYEKCADQPGLTMQTGFGAFRRDRFLELGGFDDLYLPGTVEDADLCFRGYRRGWKGYYCSDSIVHHMGQMSFKKAFGSSGIERMNRRNLYLFTWKNLRSPILWAEHLLLIVPRLVWDALRGRWGLLAGFGDALGRLPMAMGRRERGRQTLDKNARSDREIFAISRSL